MGVFVYSAYTNVTKGKRGDFFFFTFPWKCCELYDALNLFGRSCQANEVSEWGRPGGSRGQPRASYACQAAVLWGCNPQPDCNSGHGTALWQCLAHTAPICHTKADLHSCMCGPLVHVKSMYIGTYCIHAHTHTLFTVWRGFLQAPTRPPWGWTAPTSCQ